MFKYSYLCVIFGSVATNGLGLCVRAGLQSRNFLQVTDFVYITEL